jgi:hypothetical protein
MKCQVIDFRSIVGLPKTIWMTAARVTPRRRSGLNAVPPDAREELAAVKMDSEFRRCSHRSHDSAPMAEGNQKGSVGSG